MENSGEEAPMYSDSDLLTKLQELCNDDVFFPSYYYKDNTSFFMRLYEEDALLESGNKGAHVDPLFVHTFTDLPPSVRSLPSLMTNEIFKGNDAHSITLKVLKHLSGINWAHKPEITLAIIIIIFGDFWLLVRIYADNVVNDSMADDQNERTCTNNQAYRNQIEANNEFIIILAKSLRYFLDLNITSFRDFDMFRDQRAIYVYWIVRCSIVAATQIMILSTRGLDQYLVGIRTPREVKKLKSLHEELMRTLSKRQECKKAIETINAKLSKEVDIVGFMRDHVDVLRGKRVLLLVSGIDIPSEDITSLKHVAINTEKDIIVWIPVINRSIGDLDDDPGNNQLETLQNSMPWYSVHRRSMVTNDAIYFFENEWGFKGTPILVLLSPSGKVLKYDAPIHMVRIWQNLSIDNLITFDDMSQQLWEKETWNLKLLVNDIIMDPTMQKWVSSTHYLYM
ncbi:hypothetical protein KSS87_018161 [Heliosperma pusillum]|nr:hypothetical protein KSS87_018161 [Heliosperma pusillum]